jgi:hypothetical protein
MKRIQQLCCAITLLVVLSLSTLAGEIHTNVVQPPPPPPPASATAIEAEEATTDGTQSACEYETLISEIALSVLHLFSVV